MTLLIGVVFSVIFFAILYCVIKWAVKDAILETKGIHANNEGDGYSSRLPQKVCPQCGKQHDMDFPKCPYCGHRYD